MNVCVRALTALVALLCASVSHATLISYSATSLSDSIWRYDYSITNDTLPDSLSYFVLEFDRALYANLRDQAAPDGWDVLLLQPDLELPANGVFDSLALNGGIAFGDTLAGFSVTFDFLGQGLPLDQPFSVLDPFSFEQVESGAAQNDTVATVAEPRSLFMMSFGLLLLISGIRTRLR